MILKIKLLLPLKQSYEHFLLTGGSGSGKTRRSPWREFIGCWLGRGVFPEHAPAHYGRGFGVDRDAPGLVGSGAGGILATLTGAPIVRASDDVPEHPAERVSEKSCAVRDRCAAGGSR